MPHNKKRKRTQNLQEKDSKIPLMQLSPKEFSYFRKRLLGEALCEDVDTVNDDWIGPIQYFYETESKEFTRHPIKELFDELNEIKSNLLPFANIVSELKNKIGIRTSSHEEFQRASRNIESNPYENLCFKLDENPLVSRSALKLCNIDALTGFSLQNGKNRTFVDLCGAPGGFSQYLLYRNYTKGFGISLQGKIEEGVGLKWNSSALSSPRFEIHNGADGTGDIYNWDNILSLQKLIQNNIGHKQVDLVVADGGIDAQRNVYSQETVAHKLVASQVAAALLLLNPGGTFIIKVFGFLTDGSKALMDSIRKLFQNFCILKPITSRPASAERYLFCTDFQGLPNNFDILHWRSEIIECKQKNISPGLYQFLGENDLKMIILNTAACKKVINILHDEEDRLRNSRRRRKLKYNSNDILIQHYKTKWRVIN
jgi:cap1 methyltransferase